MATGSQQIADDYERLKELLASYPNISIIKTEGQPPNSYEIEYNLRGYIKKDDRTIDIGYTHRVRLSLPFGYPHFAPTAKPLTPIFHPDFDPAAIRLADRWQQNPSLPELVLHIGEMICAIVYNLEDPFNQEAAEWYVRQQAQLPLDTISVADIEISVVDIEPSKPNVVDIKPIEPVALIEPTDTTPGPLDTDAFTALRLERDDLPDSHQQSDGAVIQHIRDLVDANKIFAANKILSELPEGISFPDREELQLHIGKILRKTDQLFKLIEQLESMSKFDGAMEVMDNLQTIAVDVPGVEALKARIQQAMQVARSAAASRKSSKRATDVQASSPPSPLIKLSGKSLARSGTVFFKPISAAILMLAVAILSISLYFKDENTLSRSQVNVLQGQLLIEKKQFDQAVKTLEEARAMLSDLTILRFRKGRQEQSIDALLSSTDLQEGLQGRVLYQGQYVSASDAAAQEKLAVLTDQAQSLAGQNKIAEALSLYRQALQFATNRHLEKQQTAINETIQSLELRQTLAAAEKAEQENNWSEAAEAYRKALTLSDTMMNLGTTSDITSRMTAATFRYELDQSKKSFTQSQWRETIKYLEQAQRAININPNVVSEKERQDLHQLLINARLYLTLSTAREAFQQKNWQQAIEEYQNALDLLTREPETAANVRGESLGKIKKTLLMVKIAQIQDQIVENESKGDKGDPATILARYKEIQKLIAESEDQNDPAVKDVSQKIADKIDKQQDLLLQREKIAWLEGHFDEIFRANYPTFKNSKLTQPKAVFLKKISGRIIFTLSCLEQSQGSASKLELNYQFDLASGKWSLYGN
ncbi:MAG: hypothetical protein FWD79_03925 [Desulfobulbus sp.]|nr:hypothetical protein [Desulfobulbus sp.]